jgi:CSLREA domain-containing protein
MIVRASVATGVRLWIIFLLVLVISLPIQALDNVHAQEAGSISVLLQVPEQVAVGEVIPLTLQITGGSDAIGGMEALALFDPSAVEFAAFYPALQPSTAQAGLGTLISPDTAAGAAVGYYTCATPECQEVGAAFAEMATAGIASTAPDLLATVELFPLVSGQVEIRVDNLQLVDHNGQPLAVVLEQSSVVVQVGDEGESYPAPTKPWELAAAQVAAEIDAAVAELTGDDAITHVDVMEVAISWHLAHEQFAVCAGAESSADLNQDGCVTVADVQLAAAHVGADVPQDAPVPIFQEQLPTRLFIPTVRNDDSTLAESNGDLDLLDHQTDAEVAASVTFYVDSTGDEPDKKQGNGICRTAQNTCTLRAAIVEANSHNGVAYVYFNIPGSGIHTIQLNNRLPTLSNGNVIINGYSQPGAKANTHGQISNANILIQIRGQGEAFDGLTITSANNRVRGLAFFNLRRSIWVYGSGATNNEIIGNFIGTDATSTFESPTSTQQGQGVKIEQGAQNNRVGGTKAADRNVISGNQLQGIGLWHWPTRFNVVYNNLIGLSADGTRRLANRTHGIDVNFGAANNTIGGTGAGQRNVVSGNGKQGIEVSHTQQTANNQVVGNYVGTDVSGNAAGEHTKNHGFGIQLKDRVHNNTVAHNVIANNAQAGISLDNFGTCCLQGNVITNNRIGIGINDAALGNHGKGIRVQATASRIGPGNIIAYNTDGGILLGGNDNDGNTITENSIFGNAGLGIDIVPVFSVNQNDPGDGDSGPNEQLNFPVIQSASPTVVTGTACGGCRVEIFIADGTGSHGQGRTFVGAATAGGGGGFSVSISGVSVGDRVTSTATDAAGNTSEFSANVTVQ